MSGVRRGTTIKQVAAEAGVSMMTVSAVLRPDKKAGYPVAETTRDRVLAAARKLHYFPSAVAQGMRQRRINTLGVVLVNPKANFRNDPYVCGVLDGVIAAANAAGQNTTLFTAQRWSNAAESLSGFCDGRTDGLVILSPLTDSDIVPALLEAGLPFVLINGHSEDARVSSVECDSRDSMETMVRHLLECGHRTIAHLTGRASSRTAQRRYEGYRSALTSVGIVPDPLLVHFGSYGTAFGYEQTRYLLTLPADRRPTAICCGCDKIAIGALRALDEAGIVAPDEMSITGFDDIPDAAMLCPPLTTISQPLVTLGKRGTELLLETIEAGIPLGIKEVLPTRMIFRRSIAPPSQR